jgi:hypothetical protein
MERKQRETDKIIKRSADILVRSSGRKPMRLGMIGLRRTRMSVLRARFFAFAKYIEKALAPIWQDPIFGFLGTRGGAAW